MIGPPKRYESANELASRAALKALSRSRKRHRINYLILNILDDFIINLLTIILHVKNEDISEPCESPLFQKNLDEKIRMIVLDDLAGITVFIIKTCFDDHCCRVDS